VEQAVLLGERVEDPAGAGEIGRIATTTLMNVGSVSAAKHDVAREGYGDERFALVLTELGDGNSLSANVAQLRGCAGRLNLGPGSGHLRQARQNESANDGRRTPPGRRQWHGGS
jgi:hypothetical protein